MKTIRFGVIGLGLMGREFASAASRWCHLTDMEIKPEIISLCDRTVSESVTGWFTSNFPSVRQVTDDYNEVLGNPDIEAVYIAVPHHLHEEIYTAAIESGKHFLGEKPFGIDKKANDTIIDMLEKHPGVFARCSSEFPFFPAVQKIGEMIENKAFGTIIEVESGFLHSTDLDPDKPINWKRMIEFNGLYGCMGDLGMHACHVPFRAGWTPINVRVILSDIVKERPDGRGGVAPCRTWDNATLFCETADNESGDTFPWTIKTYRIAPGEKNTWYIRILGTKASAGFTTKAPKLLRYLDYSAGEQAWTDIETGYESAFKTITGSIFEFGFTDSILQMWAAFLYELDNGKPKKRFAGCVTPEETALSHSLFTAAIESQETGETISLSRK
ncbi:Gfo/Idh/MocA family oxidoreductase [bacterium]|nr:Gfo/Idh/MocA family oxidoreductase [bacterium]